MVAVAVGIFDKDVLGRRLYADTFISVGDLEVVEVAIVSTNQIDAV